MANVSHELRTPLNVILGYAQILRMSAGLDERQRRGIEAIHASGEYLLRLVSDVLDLARTEAGKTQLTPAAVHLHTLLHFVSHQMQLRAEQKGLTLACETESDLPAVVVVDEKRLTQVLLNLLGNAVKFTDQGRVTLRASAQPGDGLMVQLRFEVSDTGPGIPAWAAERIFKPFEQAGPQCRRAEGTGLGLAISRSIVGLMGGELRVHSMMGLGSRFWFDLQVRRADCR